MKSDFVIDASLFEETRVDVQTTNLNNHLRDLCQLDVKWWECGVDEYRKRRAEGNTPFPAPTVLENGRDFCIPTPTGAVEQLNARVFGETLEQPRGVFYHIHGGGNVLGSCRSQDLLLNEISARANLIVLSVDYPLAPEHPYPQPRVHCCLVVEWLLANCEAKWGCNLKFIGGESAGATLSVLALIHLRDTGRLITNDTICGLVLNYGNYDISGLPTMRGMHPADSTLLSWEDCEQFSKVYLPATDHNQKKQPGLSAAYNDLRLLRSALFLCGTVDPMLDDQILMSARWQIAGNEAVVRFVPGACHGFMSMDGDKVRVTRMGWDIVVEYINSRLAA